jgi:hypothetical protein
MNYDKCPTCNLNWSLNPPPKCDGSNHFRCIECKAIYAGEMLAAPAMLAALGPFAKYYATYSKTMGGKSLRPSTGPVFGLNCGADDEAEITVEDFKAITDSIAKAEGRS